MALKPATGDPFIQPAINGAANRIIIQIHPALITFVSMNITQAHHNDLPQIIDLLKLSIGEVLTPENGSVFFLETFSESLR